VLGPFRCELGLLLIPRLLPGISVIAPGLLRGAFKSVGVAFRSRDPKCESCQGGTCLPGVVGGGVAWRCRTPGLIMIYLLFFAQLIVYLQPKQEYFMDNCLFI
jgi:hypothetical protein